MHSAVNKYGECKSFCPICLSILDSNIYAENSKVLITRYCKKHGEIKTLHLWDDLETFLEMRRIFNQFKEIEQDYHHILLNVTSDCNLKCSFCFAYGGFENDFSLEKLNNMFLTIKKGSNILLYGGEPTLSDKLFNIIKIIKKNGFFSILLTNGLLLDNDYVVKLKEAGIDGVQLQFDSFDNGVYKILRGREILDLKIRALRALEKESVITYLFVVLVKDVNEKEIGKIIKYAAESDFIKCVYFTSLCYEGKINKEFKKFLTSEVIDQIRLQIGITLKDFLLCTETQHLFKKFITTLRGIELQSGSPCDIICYIYSNKNKAIIPITNLLDLKAINSFLYKSINMLLYNKDNYKYFVIFVTGIRLLLSQMILSKNKRGLYGLLLKIIFVLIYNSIFKNKLTNKFNHLLKIGVSSFMDRYNADFNLFDRCDLYMAYPDATYGPYCKRNILFGGYK